MYNNDVIDLLIHKKSTDNTFKHTFDVRKDLVQLTPFKGDSSGKMEGLCEVTISSSWVWWIIFCCTQISMYFGNGFLDLEGWVIKSVLCTCINKVQITVIC